MGRPPSDAEFTIFVSARWASLYRTAFFLVGDPGLAEDLTQTALAKTYATWAKVRQVEAAEDYARTVLVNTAMSWFRRRGWQAERPTTHLLDRPVSGLTADSAVRTDILRAIAVLPPRQRAVVVLRFYEDLTITRVADMLGCSEGSVKSQTHAALAKLRVLLGDASDTSLEMRDL